MADTNDNAEIQNKELKEFLVEVRTILAALNIDHHIVAPGFRGADMFAQTGADFNQRLHKYLSPEAIAAIDNVARNPHWFLLLVGTTAAVAEGFPASEADVKAALAVHRRMVTRDPGMPQLLEKVRTVKPSKLSRTEFQEAGLRSMLLLECGPAGECLIFNPVFLP
jgi:hypothetical protein